MIDFLLAQSQLSAPSSPQSVGWLVLTVAAICVAGNQIMGMVERFKGRKPDAADLQTFATKQEFLRLEKDVLELQRTLNSELQSINRSMGRVEGTLVKIQNNLKGDNDA